MAAKEIVQLLTTLYCFGILFVTKTVIHKASDSNLKREDKKVGHLARQDTLFILKDEVKMYALFIWFLTCFKTEAWHQMLRSEVRTMWWPLWFSFTRSLEVCSAPVRRKVLAMELAWICLFAVQKCWCLALVASRLLLRCCLIHLVYLLVGLCLQKHWTITDLACVCLGQTLHDSQQRLQNQKLVTWALFVVFSRLHLLEPRWTSCHRDCLTFLQRWYLFVGSWCLKTYCRWS